MAQFLSNSIFWIEVEKIRPNPYQPRHEFDEARLKDLADSIRMYGVLQPLVVTRQETVVEGEGIVVHYELVSGERRLRASKLAGLSQVPAIIRTETDDAKVKLELAIIENLQREDLNPVDRARAFKRLAEEFKFSHAEIGRKMGKSREYVSNSLRLLMLPDDILDALGAGKISEGHARPLMMLVNHPEEQATLFKEIIWRKMTVREAESFARRVAYDRVRKKSLMVTPIIADIEQRLTDTLGTRVQIEHTDIGGKIMINYFSEGDLNSILTIIESKRDEAKVKEQAAVEKAQEIVDAQGGEVALVDDRSKEEQQQVETDEDIYSVKNFTV